MNSRLISLLLNKYSPLRALMFTLNHVDFLFHRQIKTQHDQDLLVDMPA